MVCIRPCISACDWRMAAIRSSASRARSTAWVSRTARACDARQATSTTTRRKRTAPAARSWPSDTVWPPRTNIG